jgi:hypothetical protein
MKLVKFFVAAFASVAMLTACESTEENKGNEGGDVIVQEFVNVYCDITATDWEKCGVWAWNLDSTSENYTGGNWPGQELTEKETIDGVEYYVWKECPKQLVGTEIGFIVNNYPADDSEKQQTVDIKLPVADGVKVSVTPNDEGGYVININGEEFVPEEKPEVEEQVVVLGDHTWGLIGVNGDWNNDIEMTVANGVATATTELPANGEFKVRADHGWDINYGFNSEDGSLAPVDGTKFAVAHNGANIVVAEAGTYEVVLSIEGENEYLQITKK